MRADEQYLARLSLVCRKMPHYAVPMTLDADPRQANPLSLLDAQLRSAPRPAQGQAGHRRGHLSDAGRHLLAYLTQSMSTSLA